MTRHRGGVAGEVRCGPMAPADLAEVAALWGRVFGDSPAFVKECLDRFVGAGNQYLARDGEGRLLAILSAVPCHIGGSKGVYLYALATDEKARGAGVMTRLMAYSEDAAAAGGARFAALIPAGPALFDYYRPRGYDVDIPLRRVVPEDMALGGAKAQPADGAWPDAGTFAALRRQYLGVPWVGFNDARAAYLLEDLRGTGARFAATNGAYAVYFTGPAGVLVAELGAWDDAAAMGLLAGLRGAGGPGEGLTVTLPAAGGLLAGQGRPQPYALLKRLDAGLEVTGAYLRFGLDEIAM